MRRGGRLGRVGDPWRDPLAGVRSLLSGVFTPADTLRMVRLRHDALLAVARESESSDAIAARARADRGFSERAVEGFFRPFFGGVFLDAQLSSPRHWFEFLFAMFAQGRATLPATGMRAIRRQLASGLPAGTVRLSSEVSAARAGRVERASGESFAPRAVIVASDVARGYAPIGSHLVSATVIGSPAEDDASLDRAARAQLAGWFGAEVVRDWRLLRASRVAYALPRVPAGQSPDRAVRLGAGLYACGDHLETPSINGALRSGRRAAEALLADWSSRSSAPG